MLRRCLLLAGFLLTWTAGAYAGLPAPGAVKRVPAVEAAAVGSGPYFVEARMRAAPGAVGQGYVIVRYRDDRNWLGFGLDAAATGKLAVNIVRMIDGEPKFLKQVRIDPDAGDAFYTIRLDVDGAALTAYVNGTRLIGVDEPTPLPPGIGILAQGGQFEIDGLRAGDITQAPTSIGLVHRHKQLTLQLGDAPQRFAVRVSRRGEVRAVPFSATSSDASVLEAGVDGDKLLLAPRGLGQAAVTLTSAEDPNVAVTLAVRVGEAFAAPEGRVPMAAGRVSPAAKERDVPVDTRLQIRFDQAPIIGENGSIRIVRAKDNVTVDVIRPGMELDEIGATRDGVKRVVRYKAISLDGATATIHPHDGKLAYGTGYYVLVDGNIFAGATLGGAPFNGIASRTAWAFRTREQAPRRITLRVAAKGQADFRTVQGALNHVMRNFPREQPVTIRLADGRYEGLLYLRGKDNVTLRGDSRHGAVITGENSDGINPGSGAGQLPLAPGATGGRSVFLVEDADLLRLDTLTLANTTWRSRTIGAQAEALNFSSEGRLIANEVDFFSEQDTIQVKGYAWFYRSLVAGNVDFIWGYNRAALFEESEIRSLGDSANPSSAGYLVQARTVAEGDPGFVFLNSRLTHGPGPAGNDVAPGAAFLARPGVVTAWDSVRYINCSVGPHINAQGWHGKPRGGKGWEEGGSTDLAGRPLDLSQRVAGGVLAPADAARYDNRAKVFAQFANGKGWNPQPALAQDADAVERWGSKELTLAGPRDGNPFTEVKLSATFRQGARTVAVDGFYDGEGRYKLRFMPDSTGEWEYETHSNRAALNGKRGRFTVIGAQPGNHGPVRVKGAHHFSYADGTPFWQVGTTSYGWTHQTDATERQTLATLAAGPFNKIRMLVFPNRDVKQQPPRFPFEGSPPQAWDFTRFNPAFFRHLEQRLGDLRALGIEADVILFHPYDKGYWGFDQMPAAVNERYLRYVVARLASYRNVWWSMANEFDYLTKKQMPEWDRYFEIVQARDPYQHLRSIHNAMVLYNHSKPWVTHVSVQSGAIAEDFERAVLLRDVYSKPVIYDEVKYEGNIERRWGQLSGQEMVLRFWMGAIAGTYVGHSEIFKDPGDMSWLAKGGTMRGESPARLAFFRKILSESPAEGLEPIDKWQEYPFAGKPGQYYLGYFGRQAPATWPFVLAKPGLAEGMKFKAEVIDTWNMTITPVAEAFEIRKRDNYSFADKGGRGIALPGRPYMAIRITRLP